MYWYKFKIIFCYNILYMFLHLFKEFLYINTYLRFFFGGGKVLFGFYFQVMVHHWGTSWQELKEGASIHLSFYACMHPFKYPSIYTSNDPWIHPFFHPFTHHFHLFIHTSILSSIHLVIYPFIHPWIHSLICVCIHLFIPSGIIYQIFTHSYWQCAKIWFCKLMYVVNIFSDLRTHNIKREYH